MNLYKPAKLKRFLMVQYTYRKKFGLKEDNKTSKTLIILVSVALAISITLAAFNFYIYKNIQKPLQQSNPTPFNIEKLPVDMNITDVSDIGDISTDGFSKIENVSVEESLDFDSVVLSIGCDGLVGAVDKIQGESIRNGLENFIDVRPKTHDLMNDIFNILGIKVLMVKVVDVRANNFIGNLVLQQGDKILSLDSRPSDGVALAVRTKSPIYVNTTLFGEKAQNIC